MNALRIGHNFRTVGSCGQRRVGQHDGRARTTTRRVVLKMELVVNIAVANIKSRPYHSFLRFGVLPVFCGSGPKEISSAVKVMSSRTPPIMGDPIGCCSITVTNGTEWGSSLKPSSTRTILGKIRASCLTKYPLPRFVRE